MKHERGDCQALPESSTDLGTKRGGISFSGIVEMAYSLQRGPYTHILPPLENEPKRSPSLQDPAGKDSGERPSEDW